MPAKSIFSQLKSEHQEAKDLFEKALQAEVSQREEIVDEIKKNLIPHARAEEKTLYSVLLDSSVPTELADMVKEAYEEHGVVDKLFSQLDQVSPADDMWKAKLTVIKENVEHHIKEEENELFSKAKKYINSDLSVQMLSVYEAEREKYLESLPSQQQIDAKNRAKPLSEISVNY
jgi:hemerythrin superfamily protein